jgi:hypothetical protein
MTFSPVNTRTELFRNLKSTIENFLVALSPRTSTFGGIVRPSCVADYLMPNS